MSKNDKSYSEIIFLSFMSILFIFVFAIRFMKPAIHPQFYTTAAVSCACGNKFTTGSTLAELHTEICSKCHPFYTGKQNLVDTAGRVDKFKQRLAAASAKKASATPKKPRKTREPK